jgi:hypothetical protein
MLLFAIGEFHKTNDPKSAQDYLETHINKNFVNVGDLSKYVQWLDAYIRDFKALGRRPKSARTSSGSIPDRPKLEH